ncbi:hypothetical protein SCB71_14320 [Herbiconiux sp. KACC 21604]|uniref:hypothetical protein n=1 Tax=unclassified Herbiconiux TaxID=2618217 RepID=UPI0014920F86|nr:hypothetical protein [Herbiconiux sp. SALV-R1]QJU54317.1 hypothetical protein HL652_12260 [Herbiconiux sp. SALV-R1]WPO85387.1 hypothetical protein SCB71_14320 [Herbiconiux sp. KACC 21604]
MAGEKQFDDPSGLLDELARERIRDVLAERGAMRPCSRCGSEHLGIFPRLSYVQLQTLAESIGGRIEEQSAPVVVVACSNCGAIYQHALGALGLMGITDEAKSNG